MTPCKELTGEKREKFKKWLKQFQKENDRSPTIEEVYNEATKTTVVEHFEAYGQCRDSRRIADLENKLSNVSYQLEGRELELKELNKKLSQAEADYDKMFWQKNETISNLQAQIEKMKNWCNCKNYQQCLIELAEQGKGMKPSECCVNCKKWELQEK